MGRTIQEFQINGESPDKVRLGINAWLIKNEFSVLRGIRLLRGVGEDKSTVMVPVYFELNFDHSNDGKGTYIHGEFYVKKDDTTEYSLHKHAKVATMPRAQGRVLLDSFISHLKENYPGLEVSYEF